MIQCSTSRNDDILIQRDIGFPSLDDGSAVHEPAVKKKDLEAPKLVSNRIDHELLANHSRMHTTAQDLVDQKRILCGNAFGTHFAKEILTASKINRGPPGRFKSSRLHLDVLLGKDETIGPSDYLNFENDGVF